MLRSRHIFTLIFSLLAVFAGLASCKKDWRDNSPNEPLTLSRSSMVVGRTVAKPEIVGVNARDAEWSVTVVADDPTWITLSATNGPQGWGQRVEVTIGPYTPPTVPEGQTAPNRTATLVFSSGGATKNLNITQLATALEIPGQNPDAPDNREIFKLIEKWYYWADEVARTGSDPNQSYVDFFDNYFKYLKTNAMDGKIWAMKRPYDINGRYLYSRIERNPVGTVAATDPPLTYGMEFDMRSGTQWQWRANQLVGRIFYVQKNSPAELATLRRADWFYSINGQEMSDWAQNETGLYWANIAIEPLVSPTAGTSATLGRLNFVQYQGGRLDMGGTTNPITPVRRRFSPVIFQQTFTLTDADTSKPAHRIGYLVLSAFDGDGFENELRTVFSGFKGNESTGITDLVVDLRYNRTGTVENALAVANLIVPAAADGKVFAKYEFKGAEATANTKTVNFAHDATNGVGIGTVYILTSSLTAGASELLINALKGIEGAETGVKLVVIGDKTEGMNMGQVRQRVTTEKWDYDVWLVAFSCKNALDRGNYEYGFVPNGGNIREWDNVAMWLSWGWKTQTGADQDPLLKAAVDFIVGFAPLPAGQVTEGSTSVENPAYPRKYSFPATMTMTVQ